MKIRIRCPYGTVGHIKDFGISPEDAKVTDSCLNNNYTQACSAHLAPNALQTLDWCIGKPKCSMNITLDTLFHNPDKAPANCKTDDSIIFVQYSCIQDTKDLVLKRQEALEITCIGIFMCMIFLIGIYWLKENSKLTNIEWDVATVTAGDFAVEYHITPEMYQMFIDKYY
jgi:hypothetical protein